MALVFENLKFEICVCFERPLCSIEGGLKGNGRITFFALSLFNSRLIVDHHFFFLTSFIASFLLFSLLFFFSLLFLFQLQAI